MITKCVVSAKRGSGSLNNKKSALITIILLSDKFGHRMKSYGALSLISINNKKLIDIQIEAIKEVFSNFEIVVCCGIDADKIHKHIKTTHKDIRFRVVENQVFESSNSCESLRLCLNNTDNNKLLICDGGLVLNKGLLLCLDQKQSCVICENNNKTLEVGLNCGRNNYVEHFSFGASHSWCEVLFLNNKDIIDSLRKILNSYESKNRLIFEAINELLLVGHKIKNTTNDGSTVKINNIKTYHNTKGNIK
jgi:hypothetical protein